MMKKGLLLLVLMMIALLPFAVAEEHVCKPSGLVDLDLNERWDVCSCGARLNVTTHQWETDDWGDKVCVNCGAAQYLWDDGMLELQGYDEYDNCVRQLNWSAEGELLWDSANIFQYDGEGNITYAWYYESGRLFAESEFVLLDDGVMQEIRAIEYYQDGSMSVSEYNEQGDQTLVAYYFDGVLESTLQYEYTYDENGFVTQKRTFSDGALVEQADYVLLMEDEENYTIYAARVAVWYDDGTSVVYLGDEIGDIVSETKYDEAGNITLTVTYENEYDEEGNLRKVSTMENGVLTLVAEYALDESGWAYCAKEIIYDADGSTVEILYDEFGEIIE